MDTEYFEMDIICPKCKENTAIVNWLDLNYCVCPKCGKLKIKIKPLE